MEDKIKVRILDEAIWRKWGQDSSTLADTISGMGMWLAVKPCVLKAMDDYAKLKAKEFTIECMQLHDQLSKMRQEKLQLENVIERWHHNTTKTI